VILDSTNKSIQVKLGEATITTESDIVASFVDITIDTFTPGANDASTNGTTPVTAIAAPVGAATRQVKEVIVTNRDSVNHNAIVIYNNNGTLRYAMTKELVPNDSLVYRPDALQGPKGDAGATGPAGASAGTAGTPADFGIFWSGGVGPTQEFLYLVFTVAIDLPINLTGSQFGMRVAPTSTYVVTIKQNGSSIGSLSFAASTGVCTPTFTSAVALSPGDIFELVGQSTLDATARDISFGFVATFA
jgi:hypothetical protein